jgi:hypothetical protein
MPETNLRIIRAKILVKILPDKGGWRFLPKPVGLVLAKNKQ